MNLNLPAWQSGLPHASLAPSAVMTGTSFPSGPYQESWHLSWVDPSTQKALELRFSVLISNNGFRRIAEAWGAFFHKVPGKETTKVALKETFDLKHFTIASNKEGFQLGSCEFTNETTRGKIQSKGQTIEWDLTMSPRETASFDLVPSALRKARLVRNVIITPQPDLQFQGKIRINGTEHVLQSALGMQGHQYGQRSSHSWIIGHCNSFKNEQGASVPFVFEGISLKAHLIAGIPSPTISSFYFLYGGKKHHFNTVRDAVRLKSHHTLSNWTLQAERGDLLFRAHAGFEHKDFAGWTHEDTDGSLVYGASSKFSRLEIHVYQRGKLETALHADQCAYVEICSRKKNPYVPILL